MANTACRRFNGTYCRQAPTRELARLCVTLGRRAGWRTAGEVEPAGESAGLSTHHHQAHTGPIRLRASAGPLSSIVSWRPWAEDPCLRTRQPAAAATPVCFSLCSAHPGSLTHPGRRIMLKRPNSLPLSNNTKWRRALVVRLRMRSLASYPA